MADIDEFASALLEQSKRFFEKAKGVEATAKDANLHASLLLAFCSLEAHINAISDEFKNRPELPIHSKGVLLEHEVRLVDGEFLPGGFRMSRLEDRILLLFRHFSGAALDKKVTWWAQLKQATEIRNKLTHPKAAHPVTVEDVKNAILGVVAALDALYLTIYKKPFPAAGMGLDLKLDF